MKKWILLAILTALLLTACGEKTPTETLPPETLPPVTETIPVTEPETEPPTEPEVPLESGAPLMLMGQETETFQEGQTLYIRLEDFLNAAGTAANVQNDQLLLDGRPAKAACLVRRDGDYAPVLELAEELGWEHTTDDKDGKVYIYPGKPAPAPEGIQLPILMYHAVSDDPWGVEELHVSPANLEAQIQYLLEHDYDMITFEDLPNLAEFEKPVLLTFDDGYKNNYENLYPLLQKYQVKATIFMITDHIGWEKSLSAEQIQEMAASGLVSFQSHTATHPDLPTLEESELVAEFESSQMTLLRLTGFLPRILCYPKGGTSELVQEVAARYFDYGLMMGPGGYVTGDDPFTARRYYVARSTSLGEFADMVARTGKQE